MNLAYKILSTKLKSGELVAGQQIGIQIDQTLTHDHPYFQNLFVTYYDQYMQLPFQPLHVQFPLPLIVNKPLSLLNLEFIRSVAKKHGITFSKPGNGVCHQ